MDSSWMDNLIAFIIGGGLIGFFDVYLRWRASKQLARKSDIDSALALIDQLQEDNERLRERLNKFESYSEAREREIAGLRVGVLILIDQLDQMGIAPRWTPERHKDVLGGVLIGRHNGGEG